MYYDYDLQNQRIKRSPTAETRLQLGAILYKGKVDSFITAGLIRYPASQQLIQKRPIANLDFYPIKSEFLTLRQYHKIHLPFRKRSHKFMHYDHFFEKVEDLDGVIYQPGLNPVFSVSSVSDYGALELSFGEDLWSYMYSRPLFLEKSSSEESLTANSEEKMPLIGSRQFLRLQIQPAFNPKFKLRAGLHYESRYATEYHKKSSPQNEVYGAERSASYRLRLSYALTNNISVINDFYHYYQGFFASDIYGNQKRLKNVFRITALL